ncbi:MAG: hypothetical protein A2Z20_07405 [Bdellovibrionales bacterium RBG_16_40_8]|nr:MAG: hypothetical protein A2Z20_07405 [Bdellovibrionales bacterium RBG_16_40_8]
MGTKNKKLKDFIKGVAFGVVVIALAMASAGCGKKNKGSSVNRNPYWWGGGYQSGGLGYNGGSINGVSGGIDYNGQYMVILATSTQSDQMGYGQSYVQGEIQIYSPMGCLYNGNVGLNPGIYQLSPLNNTPASFSNGLLSGATLLASGPGGQAVITIPYASFFQTNVCGLQGMAGILNIEEGNRVACGLSTGFTDQIDVGMCR